MDTLNFSLSSDIKKEDVVKVLAGKGYKKIGHVKQDCAGFCIMINRKQFFELSEIRNPDIEETSNISDLSLYC